MFIKKVIRIKKRADRAFSEGNFEKAYELYNQALIYEPNDYDLTACLVGAALNLGLIDEVFEKSNYLIGLDEHKAQVIYLFYLQFSNLFIHFEIIFFQKIKGLLFKRHCL